MLQEGLDRSPSPTALKMSSRASAFSIAAIIGEQTHARASDNVSPSGKQSWRLYTYCLM